MKKFVHLSSVLIILIGCTRAARGDHTTHQLLSNERWNTVARGLVSAVPVDVTGARSAEDVERAVQQTVVRRSMVARRPPHPQVERVMQRLRRHRPRMLPLRYDRILVCTHNNKIILPGLEPNLNVKRQFGGGKLTFTFVGFASQEETQFRNFLNQAIPVVESIYGLAAQSANVTVRIEKNLAQALAQLGQSPARELEGGFYDVSRSEIIIPPLLFGNFEADALNLLHLVIHAFHGSLMFSFDAWEEGFAQAVALIAFKRIFPDFDPLDDPFYFIQTYDMLNQPALGNSTFYPPTGFDGMTPWRIGMSLSAWLKVYAENPNFFLQFNAAYYAQFDPNAPVLLAGNVPALKQMAMGIVPTVEGLSFTDWYRRQFVLDTSISLGNKIYSFNFPENISIIVVIYYYRTEVNGDETPLQGTTQLCYSNDEIDCDFNDPNSGLFAEEGNEAVIVDGVGAIAPQFFNIGGPNRIFVDMRVDDFRLRLVFPYGVAGQIGAFNQLFGAVLGSEDGDISVTVPGSGVKTATVSRGVFNFGSSIGVNGPTRLTVQYTPTGGKPTTVVRNVAWGFYSTIFFAPPTVLTLSRTFPAGINGFHMFSLPLIPLLSDEADALGIARNRLLLARFKPDLPGDNKYELYPNLTKPLGPGVGMWLRVEQDVTISVQGVPLPSDQDGEVELLRGFNQVGVPHNRTYTVADLRVKFRDQVFTIDQAIASGVLSQGVWGYSQAGGFTLLNNQSLIEPFRAYFVRSVQGGGVSLIFPAPAPRASRVLASRISRQETANRQRAEGRGQKAEGRRQRAEGRRQRAEGRGQRAEGRGQKAEGRRQKAEGRHDRMGGARTRPSQTALGWTAQLSAISPLAQDMYNGFGVAMGATDGLDNAHDVVQPPEVGRFVSLSFPAPGEGGVERLAYDVRAPFAGEKVWDFVVESDLPNANVTLMWDTAQAPRRLRLHLIDLDAGNKKRSMRKPGSYQFRTGVGLTVRRFRIVASARTKPPLAVSGVKRQADLQGITFTTNVNQPCHFTAVITSATGQVVRALAVNQPVAPGVQALRWDRRNQAGAVMPHGIYFLNITVTDDDGEETRVVEKFHIGRRFGGREGGGER